MTTIAGLPIIRDEQSLSPDTGAVAVKCVPYFDSPIATGEYVVKDADYTELMSAGPSWSPNKPAGVFRVDDLWHYVDKYRAAQ